MGVLIFEQLGDMTFSELVGVFRRGQFSELVGVFRRGQL